MVAEPSIRVEYIRLTGVRLRQRPYISGASIYPAALLLAQLRPHLKSAPTQPFTQHPAGHYREKVLKVLDLAIETGVHFCILPEYSLPVSCMPVIRERLRRQAPPHSIFCLPLEHVPVRGYSSVLKRKFHIFLGQPVINLGKNI